MALSPDKPKTDAEKRAERDAQQQDVLLREVDEAVRQDQFSDFVQKYGKPLGGAIALGLLIFGGVLAWTSQRESGHEEVSEQLVKAMDQLGAGNTDTATKSLAKLEADGGAAAAAVAKLSRAAVSIRSGTPGEAARLFGEVAADADAPQPYRDLATIRQIALNYEKMKPADIVTRLKPLAKPGSPFFGSAGELLGAAYLDMGKPDLAGPLFAQIAKDEKLPATQRSRARQLAGLMGVDAIVDVDQTLKALQQDGAAQQASAQ